MPISSVIKFTDNSIVVNDSPSDYVGEKFLPGLYDASGAGKGNIRIKMTDFKETHLPFKNKALSVCVDNITAFFKDGVHQKVQTLGFVHKLGILLHGKQGTGKTSMMNFFAKEMIEKRDAIAFLCSNSDSFSTAIGLANGIREIQDNLIIFLCDEFDQFASRSEAALKNFLDGNDSIDNTIVIACTNYLDKIPNTIKKRKSRFRVVEEVKGIEDSRSVYELLKAKSDLINPELFTEDEMVTLSEKLAKVGATIDDIKHTVLGKLTDANFNESIATGEIGFGREYEEDSWDCESDGPFGEFFSFSIETPFYDDEEIDTKKITKT